MALNNLPGKAEIFAWLMQREVHEYFDVDGRPIGEGRSQAFAQVETAFKTCPFAGSRYQHAKPMNVSALQSILPEWQTSLALLAQLSRRYQTYYAKPVMTYYDLALISGLGVFLSDYMALRRNEPIADRQFPVWLTGLYKVCLGFQQATFLAMMNDQFASSPEEQALPDAKGFYAYLEEQELLIGEAEVCGGSEEMISRAYETMLGRHPLAENVNPLPLASGLVIDWEAFDVFSFHTSNMWRKAILFGMHLQGFTLELPDGIVPPVLTAALNGFFNASLTALRTAQAGVAVEMARLTLQESGRSLLEWRSVEADLLLEIAAPARDGGDSALADAICAQLRQAFDFGDHQAVIEAEIREQLAIYETFEAAILHAFNRHLAQILATLGFAADRENLTAADLSAVYGKTVRDWPEFMRQS